jgi:hypothetical protein
VHLFFIQMKRNRTQCNSGFGFEARFFSKLRSWSFFSKIWLAEVLLLWLHVKIFLLLEFYWQLRLTPLPWPCLHSEMMIIIIFVDCGTSKMSKSLNLKKCLNGENVDFVIPTEYHEHLNKINNCEFIVHTLHILAIIRHLGIF